MKKLVLLVFKVVLWLVYCAYRAEGINGLLVIMPAKLIALTLSKYGAKIGEHVEMHSPLIIHNAGPEHGRHYQHFVVGDNCYIGRDVFLDLKDEICIQDQVTVSMRVTFITHTDVGKSPIVAQKPPTHAPIILRRGAYIGAGAIILQGVEIGEDAIVGAGAVVTKSVPPCSLVVGVPARVVSSINAG
ncbi:MAG: acyltransferase [Anaerolineales bacterium]|nr:acyltransferase [Chloroflexota bacterium]MBL6980699.1 acyltransferase [Anaerolineales bacterium]